MTVVSSTITNCAVASTMMVARLRIAVEHAASRASRRRPNRMMRRPGAGGQAAAHARPLDRARLRDRLGLLLGGVDGVAVVVGDAARDRDHVLRGLALLHVR